jgi:hypothetical protein
MFKLVRRGVVIGLGWPAVVGALAGLAVGVTAGRRTAPITPAATRRRLARLEDEVADALGADAFLGQRPIQVGALADGIVELSGRVYDEWEAERAVALAQRTAGVRTVLNRLDRDTLESHLANTRFRHDAGDPQLNETHWYGLRVGMGIRRQGSETDPDRRDDKAPLTSRELGVDRAIEFTSERLDKLPTGVEGHTTAPAAPSDRGLAEDASHRRLGNVPVSPMQDLHSEGQHHINVPKGMELTLEQLDTGPAPAERRREDRG